MTDTQRINRIEALIKDVSWRNKSWVVRGILIPEITNEPPGEDWPGGRLTHTTFREAFDAEFALFYGKGKR